MQAEVSGQKSAVSRKKREPRFQIARQGIIKVVMKEAGPLNDPPRFRSWLIERSTEQLQEWAKALTDL